MLGIISTIIWLYEIALFIRFIMQWVDKYNTNNLNTALKQITEPVLTPIRDKVTFNNIDFSPLVVIVILNIITRVLNI